MPAAARPSAASRVLRESAAPRYAFASLLAAPADEPADALAAAMGEARAEAYAAGVEAGAARARVEADVEIAALHADAARLTDALAAARADADAARALAAAVDAVAGAAPTTVALHPVDLLRLQEGGLTNALGAAHPALRWEADAHLAPGDWVVEMPEAAVHRLRTPMLTALRERLGLPVLP